MNRKPIQSLLCESVTPVQCPTREVTKRGINKVIWVFSPNPSSVDAELVGLVDKDKDKAEQIQIHVLCFHFDTQVSFIACLHQQICPVRWRLTANPQFA